MDKDRTNHYFIFYEGGRCKHIVARPEQVEISNHYDDNQPESKQDYSNTHESPIMTVRVHTEPYTYIEFPNVTEVWKFPGDSNLALDFERIGKMVYWRNK